MFVFNFNFNYFFPQNHTKKVDMNISLLFLFCAMILMNCIIILLTSYLSTFFTFVVNILYEYSSILLISALKKTL